jgi:hypothetical protein
MSQAPAAIQELDYPDYIESLRTSEPGLAAELADFTGVEHILQWMLRRGLAKSPLDMVGQDEFSFDFVLEFEPGGRWLAFGVT